MQGKNKTLKSIIGVALSNCTTIVSGLVVGFLIPKILSIEDYGMYKTFSLYTTYIGFFSMGIIDGIVLDYGGKDYGQLKRSKFRSFFQVVYCRSCVLCSDSDSDKPFSQYKRLSVYRIDAWTRYGCRKYHRLFSANITVHTAVQRVLF